MPAPPGGVNMRTRKEIEADGSRKDILALEVLLDIRDLLKKKQEKRKKIK